MDSFSRDDRRRAVTEEVLARLARQSFGVFRKMIHPDLIPGEWLESLHKEFGSFEVHRHDGENPTLILSAPPQHGKSSAVEDYICWVVGNDPSLRVIFTSYSQALCHRTSRNLQGILTSGIFHRIFPTVRVAGTYEREVAQKTLRRVDFLWEGKRAGSFTATTVLGEITGQPMDLGIIDDPVKSYSEACSATVRETTWEWFVSSFLSRSSRRSAIICIGTRWHVDDVIGRMHQRMHGARIVNYPAISEDGKPLFPELHTLKFLEGRKALMGSVLWNALYQGQPQPPGGEVIHTRFLRSYVDLPMIEYRVMTADTAFKTKEANDYSVLQCWGSDDVGNAYLIDQIRGKWEAPELERNAIAFWNKHHEKDRFMLGELRSLMVEDKSSGTGLIQALHHRTGIPVVSVVRTKDKYTRVLDTLGFIESGRVYLPQDAPWLNDLTMELASFSAEGSQKHDDQVDAFVDGILYIKNATREVEVWRNLI